MRAVTSHGVGMTLFTFTPLQSAKLRYYWYRLHSRRKTYCVPYESVNRLEQQLLTTAPQAPVDRSR